MNATHRNHLKISLWSLLIAFFVATYLLVVILQLNSSRLGNNNSTTAEKCLVASLHATGDDGGIGNVMFELMGLIGIARQLNRIPVILEPPLLKRLDEISEHFPHLGRHLWRKEFCHHHVYVSTPLDFCCKYDERIVQRLEWKTFANSVAVKLRYLQSFKYFWNLRRAEILHAVSASNRTTFAAKQLLFPENHLRRQQLNICVHVRRGDFAVSKMHLPSDAKFTIAGIHFLVEKVKIEDYRTPHIYIFTDNVDWVKKKIVEPYLATIISDAIIQVAANFREKPPNAEWEFSRLFCDRLLLTASTSTYGWWLAFLSRGQKIYYNRNHSSPGARSDEFSSVDFWPQHWIPLHIYRNQVVEL